MIAIQGRSGWIDAAWQRPSLAEPYDGAARGGGTQDWRLQLGLGEPLASGHLHGHAYSFAGKRKKARDQLLNQWISHANIRDMRPDNGQGGSFADGDERWLVRPTRGDGMDGKNPDLWRPILRASGQDPGSGRRNTRGRTKPKTGSANSFVALQYRVRIALRFQFGLGRCSMPWFERRCD